VPTAVSSDSSPFRAAAVQVSVTREANSLLLRDEALRAVHSVTMDILPVLDGFACGPGALREALAVIRSMNSVSKCISAGFRTGLGC
jgi:hypothetical protein